MDLRPNGAASCAAVRIEVNRYDARRRGTTLALTVPKPAADTELYPLTALRGIAALWVLVYHLRHLLEDFFPQAWPVVKRVSLSGTYGVDLFFVLSGFVIALTSRDRVTTLSGYRDFLIRRLGRIYPAYVVAHLAVALFFAWRVAVGYPPVRRCATDALSFLTHVLMIQSWTFPIQRAWNLVDWSVSGEWLVYLLFPVYAWVSRRRFGWFVALVGAALFAWALAHVGKSSPMELGLPRVLYGFGMGVVVERLYAWRNTPGPWWGGLSLGLLALSSVLASQTRAPVEAISWAPLLFAGVVYGLARSSWGVPQPLVWLGQISYALYLSHSLTLNLFEEVFATPAADGPMVWRVAFVAGQIAVALVGGHLLFAFVERPSRPRVIEWLRRRLPQVGRSST